MTARPNFLYIGPDKAGSSWLHEVLITHPQVFMPAAKDLYFFDRYYDRGEAWYLGQFRAADPTDTVVGEVCQDYLFHPDAPQRIRETLGPDVRLMVTLRDPLERAFSSWLYARRQGEDRGSFAHALENWDDLLDHGRYATHLHRFEEVFGREAVLVMVFDDLMADAQAFVDTVTDWLHVDRLTLPPELLAARLTAGRARSALVARGVRRAADLVRRADGANLVGRVKRSPLVQRALYTSLGQDRPVPTEEERLRVHVALDDEVARLDASYGLDLRGRWGWPSSEVLRGRSPVS